MLAGPRDCGGVLTKRTFIFLHGSPGNRSTWDLVLRLAPKGVEAHAIDLPDHGTAEDLEDDDPRRAEEALAARLEVVAAGRPMTLVGASFGAYSAARIAHRLPVDRLVFVAGLPHLPPGAAEQFERLAEGVASGQVVAEDLLEIYRARWLGSAPVDDARRYAELLAADHRPLRLARQFRRMARIDREGLEVAGYAADAVAIHDRDDQGVPLALGRALADRGQGVELHVLETDSHLLPLSHAGEVADIVFGEGP